MSGKINNEWELTDEEIARATSLLNARFAEERKQNTSLLDRGMFGTQNDVNRRAYDAASMSYDDFLQGDTYEDLAKRYSDKGKMAMDDTIGKVAARTGGIASSYATQAGQQAYGDWMTRLEETARAMYDSERQEAMDRRLALEDRLRKQSQEDEDRANLQKGELETDIYNAAYAGKINWSQFAERANALGLTEADFMSIVKQAEQKREDDLYDRNTEETRYDADDARNQIIDIISATVADANGVYNYNIPQSLIDASGLDPLTINAWKMANELNAVKAPRVLDLDLDGVLDQLGSGNINADTLSTYENITGESYGTKILRDGSYLAMNQENIDKLADLLGELGDKEIADKLLGGWYGYHGGIETEDGAVTTETLLKDRNYTAIYDGGNNGFWGINRDAKVKDDAGNEYTLNEDFIEQLAKDSFGGDKAKARQWIRDNQGKWGVNTKWLAK